MPMPSADRSPCSVLPLAHRDVLEPAAATCLEDSMRACYEGLLPTARIAYICARARGVITSPRPEDESWYAALAGERVLGVLHLRATLPRPELVRCYVSPAAKRRGVGSALLTRAEAELAGVLHAVPPDVRLAQLWVLATNHAAQEFYRARGWHPSGEERRIAPEPWALDCCWVRELP